MRKKKDEMKTNFNEYSIAMCITSTGTRETEIFPDPPRVKANEIFPDDLIDWL